MKFTCPANHASETPEFCSVCGLEIPGAHGRGARRGAGRRRDSRCQHAAPPAAGGGTCPDCGAPRDNERQVFCEVCGYNFVTRTAGSGPPPSYLPCRRPPGRPTRPEPAGRGSSGRPPVGSGRRPPPPAAEKSRGCAGDAARWELIVTVDANLYGTPNPDAPVGQPPRKFRLFDRETMIGRAGTEVRVQVPVHGDAGVSRRQALLIQGPDGSLVLRDLNSANGTRVDGVDVLPGVDTLLHDGAVIAMGAWTSIHPGAGHSAVGAA